MISQKLIDLLRTFSKSDLQHFHKYLSSPIFNENEKLQQLFAEVRNCVQYQGVVKDQQFGKKYVWKQLYGKKPFNDAQLRRLSSELTAQAYHFLAIDRFQSLPGEATNLLLPVLVDKKLSKHFHGLVRRTRRTLDNAKFRDANHHFQQYRLARANHYHAERGATKVETLEHLEAADRQLDAFYASQKLRNYCDALHYQLNAPAYKKKASRPQAKLSLPPSFLEYISGQGLLEEPAVKAYFLVSEMLTNPEEEDHFRRLKSFLEENAALFPRAEQYNLYIFLTNYCTDTKINFGRQDYIGELFEIFKSMLRNELILDNGVLDPQYYKNIITVGLFVKAFDWVEQFIQQYTGKLPVDNQENALNYNLANLYFHQKQYEKVIEQLREVEYKDAVYALGGKLILLKTYYELDEYLVLDSLIESFRIYLRRNRVISREVRQQYLNELRFVKQLSRVMPGDHKAVRKIRRQVTECKALADRKWILEKIEEVEEK